MTYNLYAWGTNHKVETSKKNYWDNGNLAITLSEPGEGPYATLTVNLGKKLPKNQAFVDTNNCYWAERFIQENELGHPAGEVGYSGWCRYPLYEFDLDRI